MNGEIEKLTSGHIFEALGYRTDKPLLGWAMRVDGEVTCLGGVIWDNGQEIMTFWAKPGAPIPRIAHRYAKRLIAALDKAGADSILTTLDTSKPRAKEWIERLGFIDQGRTHLGRQVYEWRTQSPSQS